MVLEMSQHLTNCAKSASLQMVMLLLATLEITKFEWWLLMEL